jgi:hypothetical protein
VFDERSRVLYAVARIDDPYALESPERQALRLGTFVNANIAGKEYDNIVVLPRHILRAGNKLWVVDENNILRNRQVSVLRTGGDDVFVNAGLDEGELISLTAVDTSLSGSEVTVNQSTPTDLLRKDPAAILPEQETVETDTEHKTAAVES